jgi:uncharacterized repeat protein (TIGR03803 family)
MVYRLSPKGAIEILHEFTGTPGDGKAPWGKLIEASDGNFYGTTTEGGDFDQGTIFRVTPSGQYTVMHSFDGAMGGGDPDAGLIQGKDGVLYGATCYTLASDTGTVFSMTLKGDFKTLYRFSDASVGDCPHSALFEGSDGLLYGTTLRGGPFNAGTLYTVSKSGQYALVHAFNFDVDGGEMQGGVVQASDGQFYGTTEYGGRKDKGTVYRVDAAGNFATIYEFGSFTHDGERPGAALVDGGDGYLYGTTYYGGAGICDDISCGTLFRISPDGKESVLHSFGITFMGAHPDSALSPISGHRLAGTADLRGDKVQGTIFTLDEQP